MEGGWTTLIAGLAGVLTTAGGALITYLTMKHKHSLEVKVMEHQHAKELMEEKRKDKEAERQDRAIHREEEAAAVEEYIRIADRLEKQIEKWEKDAVSKQKLIDELVERDTLCQVRLHKLYAWAKQSDTWMRASLARITWLTEVARQSGQNIGPMVEPPALPNEPPEYNTTPAFQARSEAQNIEILKSTNPSLGAGEDK